MCRVWLYTVVHMVYNFAARLALFTYTEHTVHCILGYNDFNNLFLPGHLMAANFNSKTQL